MPSGKLMDIHVMSVRDECQECITFGRKVPTSSVNIYASRNCHG